MRRSTVTPGRGLALVLASLLSAAACVAPNQDEAEPGGMMIGSATRTTLAVCAPDRAAATNAPVLRSALWLGTDLHDRVNANRSPVARRSIDC